MYPHCFVSVFQVKKALLLNLKINVQNFDIYTSTNIKTLAPLGNMELSQLQVSPTHIIEYSYHFQSKLTFTLLVG